MGIVLLATPENVVQHSAELSMKIYRFFQSQINHLLSIGKAINFIGISALLNVSFQNLATAQIVVDQTLGAENSYTDPNSSIDINGVLSNVIEGGAIRGTNLFHSFNEFNVKEGQNVYFINPPEVQHILSRITGNNPSDISGTLGVLGNADLFLINPNGIIFGPKVSLNVKGSFLATTANSMIFGDGAEFSTKVYSNPPPLTVSIPIGLQFRESRGDIIQKPTSFSGSKGIQLGETLALVGGNVTVQGGFITITSGRLEIGSVGTGYVNIQPIQKGWSLSYEGVQDFRDIEINSGSSLLIKNGSSQVQGRSLKIKDGSQILGYGGSMKVVVSNSLDIRGFDLLDEETIIFSGLANEAITDIDSGGISISAKRLTIQDGGRISSRSTGLFSGDNFTIAKAKGGDLVVNASESVQLIGDSGMPTGLFSDTGSFGAGGSITINTQNLSIQNGASVSAKSLGVNGLDEPFATGAAGNINITASESLKLSNGFITAETNGLGGKAGDLKIETGQINVFDRSKVSVSGAEGQAGNLIIDANSLFLNQGLISAEIGKSGAEDGANIAINIRDLLRLENESQISARASEQANGGNINISTPILLAFPPTGPNGSDIKASAIFGTGGKIEINAKGLFGIQERDASKPNQSNDIDASSQFGPSGQVQINSAINPTQGIEELPSTVIDPNTLVAQNPCKHSVGSEFVRSGRGGLPPSISQDFDSTSSRVDLVQPIVRSAEKLVTKPVSKVVSSQTPAPLKIVPAQGWIYNDKGQAVLVAYNPSTSRPQRSQPTPASCPAF